VCLCMVHCCVLHPVREDHHATTTVRQKKACSQQMRLAAAVSCDVSGVLLCRAHRSNSSIFVHPGKLCLPCVSTMP
jgi:hypothetical protein